MIARVASAVAGRRRVAESSLFGRLFTANAVVLLLAGLALALSPVTVSAPIALAEATVLVAGLAAMLVVTLVLMRRVLAPLERLRGFMRRVDPLRPGERIASSEGGAEVRDLAHAFNAMLDRLESERRESGRRALAAQEEERLRIAHELHDEIGQLLTAVLLQLERGVRQVPEQAIEPVAEAQRSAEAALDELRQIVRRLRPEALDDLGIVRALSSLATRTADATNLTVERSFKSPLSKMSDEAELVVYRVAQEALTNASRHANASRVLLALEPGPDGGLRLRVRDDGVGLDGAGEGTGIRGMRERAMLIRAGFAVDELPEGGVEVRLDVPAEHLAK